MKTRALPFITVTTLLGAGACNLLVDLSDLQGGGAPCITVEDCPLPSDPCQGPACVAGSCTAIDLAEGAPSRDQLEGNCYTEICRSNNRIDDDDVADDDNTCTLDECLAGESRSVDELAGVGCDALDEGICDGAGHCVECVTDADCVNRPDLPIDACRGVRCEAGLCLATFAPANTPVLAGDDDGDCMQQYCDGQGSKVERADNGETPRDGNDCTYDRCDEGQSTPEILVGASCGQGSGMTCDSQGVCTGCNADADCSMESQTACVSYRCDLGTQQCVIDSLERGTPMPDLVGGDCLFRQCNGSDGVLTVAAPDLPPSDDNDCTNERCYDGIPMYLAEPINTYCEEGEREGVCDGMGECGDCNSASQCSPPNCTVAECVDNSCELYPQEAGTVAEEQPPGDCRRLVCDGEGSAEAETFDDDPPDDGNACTVESCDEGQPASVPAARGALCADGGGQFCDGAGSCVECLTNAHCPATEQCTPAGWCGELEALGEPCSTASQCASGYCADGVCCDGGCGGSCQACVAALTGEPDGRCENIPSYSDPEDDCAGDEVCHDGSCCIVVNDGGGLAPPTDEPIVCP